MSTSGLLSSSRLWSIVLAISFISISKGYAQEVSKGLPADSLLKKVPPINFKKVVNASYATLLGAEGGTGTIGNYASIDPLNGQLSFKGTMAFGNKDKSDVSFLNISAKGGLVDGNFATIFQNTKLNSTGGIQLDYSFRISKPGRNKKNDVSADGNKYVNAPLLASVNLEYNLVEMEYQRALSKLKAEMEPGAIQTKFIKIDSAKKFVEFQMQRYGSEVRVLEQKISDSKTTVQQQAKMADTLGKYLAEMEKLDRQSKKLTRQLDSLAQIDTLGHRLPDDKMWFNMLESRKEALRVVRDAKMQKLVSMLTLEEYGFTWLTVTAGAGKKDYWTFDKKQPFNLQLQNPNRNTFRIGLAVNHFYFNENKGTGWMFNAGVQRIRDNNLEELSTQEVLQEVTFKNVATDSVRKVAKKYQAYTEPEKIVNLQQWNLYGNLYYLFAKGEMALHFFPSYYSPDDGLAYVDAGLGLVFSFKDRNKEKSKLNLEAFVLFSDVFDDKGKGNRMVDRNQFGVRVTLPFNKLSK